MPGLPLNTTAALSESGRPRRHGEQAGLTKFSRDVRKARRQPGWVTYTYGRITMNSRLTLAGFCLLAAFGLAACGGGGGGTAATETPPMMESGAPPPPADLTALFAAAQDANDNALDAGEAAANAEKSATENVAKLTTAEVNGESSTAMMSAQAILDAKAAADKAVMDAQAALDAANMAKTHAADIDADHPQKASLDGAIEDAIDVAEAQLEAATDVRDGDAVNDAVEEVTGGEDADPQGTPRSIATAVGTDIAMALLPMSETDGAGMRVTDRAMADVPLTTTMTHVVRMTDHQGHTWEEIITAGGGTVQEMRVATGTDDTNPVRAASIAGMTLDSTQTATTADEFEEDGLEVAATYKGIAGTAFCQGEDCRVETVTDTDARKFAGSWYFTPAAPMTWYIRASAEDDYAEETLFVRFGHWLTSETTDGVTTWTVNRYAYTGGATTPELGVDEDLDGTAEYTGDAAGMSVYKSGDDIDSGAFTATVNLTATFGATPTVKGTVSNFDGTAVNTGWDVELLSMPLGTVAPGTPGTTVTDGQDGEWTGQAYGPADARPEGIFGGFNAHFSDGHVAGAYSTRKAASE